MVLGLGTWEFVVVGLALLILFGPEHAPRAMRTLGRWQTRVRETLQEIEETLDEETREAQDLTDEVAGWTTTGGPNEIERIEAQEPADWEFTDRSAEAGDETDKASDEDEPGPEEDADEKEPG